MPTDLTAVALNYTSIRVAWHAPISTGDIGDQYVVTVSNSSANTTQLVSKTEYTLTDLNPSSHYTVTVRATDKDGKPFSASVSLNIHMTVSGNLPLSSTPSVLLLNGCFHALGPVYEATKCICIPSQPSLHLPAHMNP